MDLDALLRRQHCVLTSTQAHEFGLTDEAIRWRLRSGEWISLRRGLYQAYPGTLSWNGRAHALTLRLGPSGALTLGSAAHLHGMAAPAPQIITAAVVDRQVTRLPGTRVKRRSSLTIVRRQGIPITDATQTVLDLTAEPGVGWREVVHTAARWVHRKRTTVPQLVDGLAARARHPQRHVLLSALVPIAEGAESVLEVRSLTEVVHAHGLPRPRLQMPVGEPDNSLRRDAEWEMFGVILEIDGRLYHEGESLHRDRRRDRRSARTGRVTIRAGFVDIEFDGCELALDIALTLRSRGYLGEPLPCGQACPVRSFRAAG